MRITRHTYIAAATIAVGGLLAPGMVLAASNAPSDSGINSSQQNQQTAGSNRGIGNAQTPQQNLNNPPSNPAGQTAGNVNGGIAANGVNANLQQHTITGHVSNLRNAQINGQTHVLATLRTASGGITTVDLGAPHGLSDVHLNTGDEMTVAGTRRNENNNEVIAAETFELANEAGQNKVHKVEQPKEQSAATANGGPVNSSAAAKNAYNTQGFGVVSRGPTPIYGTTPQVSNGQTSAQGAWAAGPVNVQPQNQPAVQTPPQLTSNNGGGNSNAGIYGNNNMNSNGNAPQSPNYQGYHPSMQANQNGGTRMTMGRFMTGQITQVRNETVIDQHGNHQIHVMADLRMPDGKQLRADLGAPDQLASLNLKQGQLLGVEGTNGNVNGQPALIADNVANVVHVRQAAPPVGAAAANNTRNAHGSYQASAGE